MLPMLHIQCLSACKRNSKYNVHKKSWFCWVKSNYCMTVCSKTASVVYVLLETKRWQSSSSSPSSATLTEISRAVSLAPKSERYPTNCWHRRDHSTISSTREGGRGRGGKNYALRARLLYVCVWVVYTAAAFVSLSVVTGRISVSVHLLVHLAVWHLQCILDYLLKVLMLILKIKKLFSSAHVKLESVNLFACQFLLQ